MPKETFEVNAARREIAGKQVKALRAEGLVPAVLYGPTREPLMLQVPERELAITLAKAGGSAIIQIKFEGEDLPAIVRDVQRDNLRDSLIHVDFYAVAMDRAIRTEVPLEFVNEPDLVASGEAMLVTGLTSVEVECLPGDLPSSIEVDTTQLVDMDTVINVSDLPVPEGVTIMVDPDELIATLTYPERAVEEEEEGEEEMLFDAEDVEVIGRGRDEGEDFEE
jgi:large subunit ribosomal protein L25